MSLDDLFPGEMVQTGGPDGATVHRMTFDEGFGVMTTYPVMDGVLLAHNDFHTLCPFPVTGRRPGLVEINHCRTGRFECRMRDGRAVWLGPQDFSVSDMGRPPSDSRFSRGVYQGISLVVEPRAAEAALARMLGEGAPRLTELFRTLLADPSFLLLRSEAEIQQIFAALYAAPEAGRLAWYRLKSAELMCYLQERQTAVRRAGACYHRGGAVPRVREIAARLEEDLQAGTPVAALAEEYQLGASTVKKYFRQLYGEGPCSYRRRRRLEEAAFLLTATGQSVARIAGAVGYQNAGKFSAAFRAVYGVTPTAYRRAGRADGEK